MGTLNYSVGRGNKSRGSASPTARSSVLGASNDMTTSASAANAQDSDDSTDITLAAGDFFFCNASQAQRLRFGGDDATVSVGHYLAPGLDYAFEVEKGDEGPVSVIDVA